MNNVPPPESLLAESAWLDRLARKLVDDPATVDDLVQDTWIAVLRHRAKGREVGRGWLRRTLVTRLWNRFRDESSRAERERAHARSERTPSAHELVERAELQRRIAAALTRLDEPLRHTALLRYLEGLTPAEIAERTGVATDTVRKRLRRAADTLRRELEDAQLPGVGATIFAALVRPKRAVRRASAGPVAPGLIAQGAALVAALTLVVWQPWTGRRPATAASLPPAPISVRALNSAPELLSGTSEITLGGDARAALRTQASEYVWIEGRLLDAAGVALADAAIGVVQLSRHTEEHPLAGSTRARTVARTTTDASGDFRVRAPASEDEYHIALELFAYAPGHGVAFRYLEDGRSRHRVELELPREIPVAGVVLGADGAPLAGAAVEILSIRTTVEGADNTYPFFARPADLAAWPQEVVADADGRFELQGASAWTELAISVDHEDAVRQRWTVPLETTAPALELHVAAQRRIEGTVVGAGGGGPVEGAIVVISFREQGSFVGQAHDTTDASGGFSLAAHKGDELSIRVTAPGQPYDRLNRVIPWIDGTSTQRMTLALDHDGFTRLDGTTPDGLPASTIESDFPDVAVERLQPVPDATMPVAGTLLFAGALNDDSGERRRGVFELDLATERWRLVAADAIDVRPSPDGSRYALRYERQLRVVDSSGAELELALPDGVGEDELHGAVWLPGSGTLVVSAPSREPQHYYGQEYWQQDSAKWLCDLVGSAPDRIELPGSHDVWDVSADGQFLALHWDTHATLTGAQLFVSRRDGRDLRPLARKRQQYYWYPRFHPDGRTVLAKHLDARGGIERPVTVRLLAVDGSRERALVVSPDHQPEIACWSPDGEHLAVIAYPDAAFRGGAKTTAFFVIDAAGARVRQIEIQNASDVRAWSVDWK